MIEAQNVTKQFGQITAVNDLTFSVERGQAVALWGANGAGKTTALRCVLGLIPFEGQILINGQDVSQYGKAVRRDIGFVPQELNFHDDMTAVETLTFYARLKKVPSGFDMEPILEQLGLMPHIDKRVGELSGGLKQRLALALAQLSDPPLLILDEPSAKLDISARDDFLTLLLDLKASGKTILFSSHRLEEVTALADRVLLLEAGRLALDAPPDKLGKRLGRSSTLHIYLDPTVIDTAMETLTAYGVPVSRNGRGVRVVVEPGDNATVLQELHKAGIEIKDFVIE